MLADLVENLTASQREQLAREFGISPQKVTDWRKGRRLPTEYQVAALAAVCRVDRHQLQDEVAMLRATPAQKEALQRILGKALAGVLVMLSCGFGAAVKPAADSGSNQAQCIDRSTRRRSWASLLIGELSTAHFTR